MRLCKLVTLMSSLYLGTVEQFTTAIRSCSLGNKLRNVLSSADSNIAVTKSSVGKNRGSIKKFSNNIVEKRM